MISFNTGTDLVAYKKRLRKDLNQVIDKDEDFICIIKLMNDNVFGEEVLGNGGEVTGESLMI